MAATTLSPSKSFEEEASTKTIDISIVFSKETGEDAANSIYENLLKQGGNYVKTALIPCPNEVSNFNKTEHERTIAKSKSIALILSKDSLKSETVVFASACALTYNTRIVLIHDQITCRFPGVDEQPQILQDAHVFHDKAITYMKQYATTCVKQLLKKSQKVAQQDISEICLFYHQEIQEFAQQLSEGFSEFKFSTFEVSLNNAQKNEIEQYQIHLKKLIANSRALVVVLSDSLSEESWEENKLNPSDILGVAIEIAQTFSIRVHILYDENNTTLLHSFNTVMPPSIRRSDLFEKDKVISFNFKHPKETAKNLIQTEKELGGCRGEFETYTRAFLSHKRSSAQGLTGRIYQGLKNDYKIFLDSEADFDLHDLAVLVERTRLFVFILSEGILDSYWCLQELRSAVDHKKPVLIIRDHQYHFQILCRVKHKTWNTFSKTLLVWITWQVGLFLNIPEFEEFYEDCVARIREYLGPSDGLLNHISDTLKIENPEFLQNLLSENWPDEQPIRLDYSPLLNTNVKLQQYMEALFKYYHVPVKQISEICAQGTFLDRDGVALFASLCPHIKTADFSNTKQLTDAAIESIAQYCHDLEELNLSGTRQITADGFQKLGAGCKNLKKLNLTNSNINSEGLASLLKNCQDLVQLILSGCTEVGDKGLETIPRNLEEISLAGCLNVSDTVLTTMASHVNPGTLRILNLSGSRITDAGLKNFGSKIWDNLQIVDISGCFNISDDGMQIFSKCVPSVTKLDLSHCSRVADPSMMHVLTNCTSLKELSIQETSVTLTSSSLDYFQTNPTNLTLLVARGCSGATDSGFATLVQCSPNLELLDISQCTQLGNQTVISAVTNCKKLQVLKINDLMITDEALTAVSTEDGSVTIPQLHTLEIANCVKITDQSLDAVSKLPALTRINCSGCSNLTSAALQNFSEKLVHLEAAQSLWLENVAPAVSPPATVIRLSECYLTYDLPDLLGKVAEVQELDLGFTQIGDGDFSSKQFPALKKLNLKSTSRVSSYEFFENCPNIESLDISSWTNGELNDVSLRHVCNLQNLKELFLERTTVGDSAIASIANSCKNLRVVNLLNCKNITSAGIKSIANFCPNLVELRSHAVLDHASLKYFVARAANIEILEIELENGTASTFKMLTKACPNIKILCIAPPVDDGLKYLCDLRLLQVLKLSYHAVKDEVLKHLPPCANLQELEVGNGAWLTNAAFVGLRQMPAIQKINLSITAVTDATLQMIGESCKQLREINVSSCQHLSPEALGYLKGCPNLKKLHATGVRTSDAALTMVVRNCPSLEDIAFSELQESSILILAENCSHLRNLTLWRSPGLNAKTMAAITRCGKLIHVNIPSCQNVDDECVRIITENCPNIRTLELENTKITSACLEFIGTNCQNITNLNLRQCQVTTEGVGFLSPCTKMKRLAISDCDLDDMGLMTLTSVAIALEELELENLKMVTDSGLAMMLESSRLLKRLNISYTPISAEMVTSLATNSNLKIKSDGFTNYYD